MIALLVAALLLDAKDQGKAAENTAPHEQQKQQPDVSARTRRVIEQHTDGTNPDRGDQHQHSDKNESPPVHDLTPADRISLALLALTSAYVFLQFYMWRALVVANRINIRVAAKSLHLTRQSLSLARTDLRPWVTIRDFGITGETMRFEADEQKAFMILMTNTGKTPAFIQSGGTMTGVFDDIPDAIPQFTPPESNPNLAPGDEHLLEAIIPAMRQETWDDIADRRLRLIVFIVIRYEDSDGVAHETSGAHEFRRTAAGVYRWAGLPRLGAMT